VAAIRQVYGIGKSKLVASPTGDAPERTFILPITMQGGFSVLWDDETFIDRYISADFSLKTITETPTYIDGFGNFSLDWSGLPMPYSFVEDLTLIWNIRDSHTFKLYPKYEEYIGLPGLFFEVNVIGTEGLNFITSDSVYDYGTFGLKLFLRTTTNQKIGIGQAPGVGATISYSYGDDSFEEVINTP